MKRGIISRISMGFCIGIVASLLFCAHLFAFERAKEGGFLKATTDMATFPVTNPGGILPVTFEYPKGAVDFWVRVTKDGAVVNEYDLDNGDTIDLATPGIFYITIYSRMGAGEWSASYDIASLPATMPARPLSEKTPPSPSSPPLLGIPESEVTLSGALKGTGDQYQFKVPAEADFVEIFFEYPKGGASFHVRVVGKDRRSVLGDFDLDNGEVIELYGGGNFYITLYSVRGAGPFTATFNPKGSEVPSSSIIAEGKIAGPGDFEEFAFDAIVDDVSILFECAGTSPDFWVKVSREDDRSLLGDFNLKEGKIIDLQQKGKYFIKIYSRSGSGTFRAYYWSGAPADRMALEAPPPEEETAPPGPGETIPGIPPVTGIPPGVNIEEGFLVGTGDFKTFIVNANIDYTEVTFTYPAGKADFWVRVIGEGGKEVLGDFDLDDSQIIQLIGGGTFYLKIYSKNGAGGWRATYSEGPTGPYGRGGGVSSGVGERYVY